VVLTNQHEVGRSPYVVECTYKTTEQYSPAGIVTGVIRVTRALPTLALATTSIAHITCNTNRRLVITGSIT